MEIGAYDLNLDSTGLEWKLEHTLVGVDPGFFGFLRAELIDSALESVHQKYT